jgi:hypothetical protein
MKKIVKRILLILTIIVSIAAIQYTPVFFLRTLDMQIKEGQNVIVYYQKGDEKGAQEVFNLIESLGNQIKQKLKYNGIGKTKMYIYKKQTDFQIRKAGLITPLFAPKWYIGDNKGATALMVSPYAKIAVHNHDSILSAAPHEVTHTINYLINPNLSYWIDNGVAGYLSNQKPQEDYLKRSKIPSYEDTYIENEVKFGNIGGYEYSYLYIEYIDRTYGWEKVIRIVRGESYDKVFHKTEKEIFDEWVKYLGKLQ